MKGTGRSRLFDWGVIVLAGWLLGTGLATRADMVKIPTLFNTGVTDSGSPRANNSSDPHYTLVAIPEEGHGYHTGQHPTVLTSATGYPIVKSNVWLGDNRRSAWITPHGNGSTVLIYPQGKYTYQTTFMLTGVDPKTVVITGQWAADDTGLEILVNQKPTGNTTGPVGTAHSSAWTRFTLEGAGLFKPGINTLDFVTHNDAWNNTGLRVEFIQFEGKVSTMGGSSFRR